MIAVQRVAAAAGFVVFIGGAFFTSQLVVRPDAPTVQTHTRTPAADVNLIADETLTDREPESGEGFTDLYGNEVSDAIATYTFDQSGSLYELHSPQTELPRLGIPKS